MLGKNQKVATPLNGARAAIATQNNSSGKTAVATLNNSTDYSGKTENKRWFQAS